MAVDGVDHGFKNLALLDFENDDGKRLGKVGKRRPSTASVGWPQ